MESESMPARAGPLPAAQRGGSAQVNSPAQLRDVVFPLNVYARAGA